MTAQEFIKSQGYVEGTLLSQKTTKYLMEIYAQHILETYIKTRKQ